MYSPKITSCTIFTMIYRPITNSRAEIVKARLGSFSLEKHSHEDVIKNVKTVILH